MKKKVHQMIFRFGDHQFEFGQVGSNLFVCFSLNLGGLLKSFSTSKMTVLLEDQTTATFCQQSSTTSAFGWQAGVGFRYSFTQRLALTLRADYFRPREVAVQNENRPNNAGRLVTRQPMAWVNTAIGVFSRFRFLKYWNIEKLEWRKT